MRQLLSATSLLAFAAGCSGTDSTVTSSENSAPGETIAVSQFELRTSLPSCGKSTAGNVFYIVKDEQLVYCDGKKYQDVAFPCDPAWLVSAGAATSCAYGGALLSAGPDNNGNGKLDKKEVVSSAAACNGATGPQGPVGPAGANGATGSQGPVGPAGANGATGSQGAVGPAGANGAQGPQGLTGPTGPAGSSCNVEDDVAVPGGAIIRCENGFAVRIFDGRDGATGATGATGAPGATGANGTNGTDGSSCSVHDNGDGTYLLTCTDGTSITLHDGDAGATGPQGPQGPEGPSCLVHDNGNHTYDVTCPDGSQVTISDGRDGEDATLGPVLINTTLVPKGVNCHNGGSFIQVGVDSDASGVLEPEEVTGSDYACGPLATFSGSITISSNADLEQLRGIAVLSGNLSLQNGFTDVAALQDVAADLTYLGALYVQNTGLTNLDLGSIFPGIASLETLQISNNTALAHVSFPQLTSIGSNLNIYGNTVLTDLGFPQLTTVDYYMNVGANLALTSASFPALTSVGSYLYMQTNPLLTSVSFPALTSVGSYLEVYGNATLTSIACPALTSVGSFLYIQSNPLLTSLSFPQFTSVGSNFDFNVANNSSLPNCRVLALKNQLTPAPTAVLTIGNSASCPP